MKILGYKIFWIPYKKFKNWHPLIDWKLKSSRLKERCSYCGWFLHPEIHFNGIKRPMKMTYCQDKDGLLICSNCANNPNSNY